MEGYRKGGIGRLPSVVVEKSGQEPVFKNEVNPLRPFVLY